MLTLLQSTRVAVLDVMQRTHNTATNRCPLKYTRLHSITIEIFKFRIGLVLDGGSDWFGNETTIWEQILMRNQCFGNEI